MKILDITVLMIAVFASAATAFGDHETPTTLQEVRELGRAKSRFLLEEKAGVAIGQTEPKANVETFHASVRPVLMNSCLACHGPENSEGRLRVDRLNPDLVSGVDVEQWREI